MACGSGAESFIKRVSENVQTEFSDGGPPMLRAVMQNMIFLSTILASERTSLFNVHEWWGAGFEIIRYTEAGFEKLNNHAFILFEGQFDSNGTLSPLIPKMVQHYWYFNEILLITAIELVTCETDEEDGLTITQSRHMAENFYFVPSLDTIEPFNRSNFPDNLSFASTTLIIGYSIIFNEVSATYPGIYYEGVGAEVIYEEREKITIKLPQEMNEKVAQEVIENYNRHMKN